MEIAPFLFQRQLDRFSPFKRRAREGQDPKVRDLRPFAAQKLTAERSDKVSEDALVKSDLPSVKENQGYGFLKNIAKRGVQLAEKLAGDLHHDAVQDFKEHLEALEKLAQNLGVDPDDFKTAIRGELSKIGAKDDGNSVIDSFELESAISREVNVSTQASKGQVNFDAQVKESLDFNFTGNFTTKEGNSVHIEAAFELDLASEVGVQISRAVGAGSEILKQDEDTEPSYHELVGGLMARLKEFKAESRKKELKGHIDKENEKQIDESRRAKRNINGPEGSDLQEQASTILSDSLPPGSALSISYNYQESSFQFDYTSYTDDKHNRAIQIYRAALRQEEVGVSAFVVTA